MRPWAPFVEGKGSGKMATAFERTWNNVLYYHATTFQQWTVVLFNHSTCCIVLLTEILYIRILAESTEITSNMTSLFWRFHVVTYGHRGLKSDLRPLAACVAVGGLVRCTTAFVGVCSYALEHSSTGLFNHRTWMVYDWLFVWIPVESDEITLTMTSQYWGFHVVGTVKQYFSKTVTYSEWYSICTVLYTICNPQHSKKFALCCFLQQNLYRVLFYRS
jgi:hypothetical protein